MITPRINFGAIYFKGYIFCVGGWNNAFTQICETFNTKKNTWQKIKSLQCEREGISLTIVGDECIVAFGDVITRGKRTKQIKNQWLYTVERLKINDKLDLCN